MKLIKEDIFIDAGPFSSSAEWKCIRNELIHSIAAVDWPPGSGSFTIHKESGKKGGEGNGVKPIKDNFINKLIGFGWEPEKEIRFSDGYRIGRLDAVKETNFGHFAVEWETGNISSSHRALNKLALGIMKFKLAGGALIVPSRELYQYLTDRIGNYNELVPYRDLWNSLPCKNGILVVFVVEYDSTSLSVERIPKGTSGRALG